MRRRKSESFFTPLIFIGIALHGLVGYLLFIKPNLEALTRLPETNEQSLTGQETVEIDFLKNTVDQTEVKEQKPQINVVNEVSAPTPAPAPTPVISKSKIEKPIPVIKPAKVKKVEVAKKETLPPPTKLKVSEENTIKQPKDDTPSLPVSRLNAKDLFVDEQSESKEYLQNLNNLGPIEKDLMPEHDQSIRFTEEAKALPPVIQTVHTSTQSLPSPESPAIKTIEQNHIVEATDDFPSQDKILMPSNTQSSTLPPQSNPLPAQTAQAAAQSADSFASLRTTEQLQQQAGNRLPLYPKQARLEKKQGVIKLTYFVTPQGAVKNIRLVQSTGHSTLDQEAIKAISRYRFYPGQSGYASHTVNFKLVGSAKQVAGRLRSQNSGGQ